MKISKLTPDQIRELAPLVPTTEHTLRHVVAGRRGVSSERAILIERAAKRIGLLLPRETLNAGCATCEFARACRKAQKKVTK